MCFWNDTNLPYLRSLLFLTLRNCQSWWDYETCSVGLFSFLLYVEEWKIVFPFFKFSQKLSWADNVWKGPKTPPIILIDSNNCNWLNCIFSFCNAQIQTNSRLQSATENCLFLTLQTEPTHCYTSDKNSELFKNRKWNY